jgi:hypothetical protein
LGILTAVLVSYVGPVRGYLAQRAELAAQRAALEDLRERRDALREQLTAIARPEVLERRARELGLALPGERTYVVRGLPPPGGAAAAPEEDEDGGLFGWIPFARVAGPVGR